MLHRSSPLPYAGYLILASCIYFLLLPSSESLFISHINQKGLRGNITFQLVLEEGSNSSVLIIESILEADQLGAHQDHRDGEESIDRAEPILFDWSLHTNALDPHMLATCSNDDLGHQAASDWQRSVSRNRSIALGTFNRWSVPFDEQVRGDNPAKSLSALLWGKSIRLKLADVHRNKIGSDKESEQAQQAQPAQRPKLPSSGKEPHLHNAQRTSTGIGISRPQLAYSTPSSSPGTQSKPLYARFSDTFRRG